MFRSAFPARLVSPSLFPLLGVEPIKGRTFAREEQGEGHDDVIVISERLWKRRFNSDPALIGKTLLLNGRSYTVIGIMPAKFEFPIPLFGVQGNQFAERVDIWKPIAFTPLELKERGNPQLRLDHAITTGRAGGQSAGRARQDYFTLDPDVSRQLQRRRFRRPNLSVAGSGRRWNADRSGDFARRGDLCLADRVREPRDHVARPGERARTRAGYSSRARRRTLAIAAANVDRKRVARSGRRSCVESFFRFGGLNCSSKSARAPFRGSLK